MSTTTTERRPGYNKDELKSVGMGIFNGRRQPLYLHTCRCGEEFHAPHSYRIIKGHTECQKKARAQSRDTLLRKLRAQPKQEAPPNIKRCKVCKAEYEDAQQGHSTCGKAECKRHAITQANRRGKLEESPYYPQAARAYLAYIKHCKRMRSVIEAPETWIREKIELLQIEERCPEPPAPPPMPPQWEQRRYEQYFGPRGSDY